MNKYPNPDKAIAFLLEIGLKYGFEVLERMLKQPFVSGSLRMSDEEFEEFERKGELRKMVENQLNEAEEGSENGH